MNKPSRTADARDEACIPANDSKRKEEFFAVSSDYAYTYRGYDFYTIDLKNTPLPRLNALIRECEAIEKACWVPQENFYEYAIHRNFLTYVMKDGNVIAFQIASYWILDNDFIFDLDETMVMKEHRGRGLAFAISAVTCRTLYLRIFRTRHIRRMTFIGLTPNLRLVNLMDSIRHTIRILDTSLNPSSNLMKIHDYIVEKKDASLVHPDYPFFLKSVFPGSLKPADHTDRTSHRIKKMLPPGIDFNGRGDAFLFLSTFNKVMLWPLHVVLLLKSLGTGIIFHPKLGLMSRKKHAHVKQYLATDENLNLA